MSAPSFCAAAIASSEVLFSAPALCSMKMRMPLAIIGLDQPCFGAQLLGQFNRALFRVAVAQELCLLRFVRQVNFFYPLMGRFADDVGVGRDFLNLFFLRGHDAF